MQRKPITSGSGAKTISLDKDEINIKVDFDLPKNFGYSLLNYGDILFFASSSYLRNYILLKNEILKMYNKELKNINMNKVEYYIMPLFFSFRHHIELRLKALYINLFDEAYSERHNLLLLSNDIKNRLVYLDLDDCTNIKIALTYLERIIDNIKIYEKTETTSEYFRFIIGKKVTITDKTIHLTNDHIILFDEIIKQLGDFELYIKNNIKHFYGHIS